MKPIFFDSGQALLRIAIQGIMGYAILVVLLRLSGKRALSKMNAFDLVVTISLGSVLGSIVVDENVPLMQGTLALGLLLALQFAMTLTTSRWAPLRKLVTGEPSVLFYRGRFIPAALRQARITDDEVRASVRRAGLAFLDDVKAVVLETDGRLSVVHRSEGTSRDSSLEGLALPDAFEERERSTSGRQPE